MIPWYDRFPGFDDCKFWNIGAHHPHCAQSTIANMMQRSIFATLSFTGCSLLHRSFNDDKDSTNVSIHPAGWSHAFSKEGDKFWYNESTGETRWSHPEAQKWSKTWDGKKEGKKGVTHQIVLIRHGQYEEKEEKDEDRRLTALGRKQAEMTGKRVNELLAAGVLSPVKCVYFSTMKRATETSDIILQQLSSPQPGSSPLRTEPCSMIREGAVCRPDPAAEGWYATTLSPLPS